MQKNRTLRSPVLFVCGSSDQIALEAVEVFGLDDAFEVEAVFAVLLELDAATLPHGGGKAQLIVGQENADGVDAVAEGLVQLGQQLVEAVAGLGAGEQDVGVEAQRAGLVALVVDGQAGDVGTVQPCLLYTSPSPRDRG